MQNPPPPPPPAYGEPSYGSQQPQPGQWIAPARSGLALASLICSLVGLIPCFFCLPSIIGLILGITALPKIGRSNGMIRGKGLAITGIILGILVPLGYLIGGITVYRRMSVSIDASKASVDRFLTTVDKEDYETAYNVCTTSGYKQRVSLEKFTDTYKQFKEENGEYKGLSFSIFEGGIFNYSATGRGAFVTILLNVEYSKTGKFNKHFVVELVGDKWLITSDDPLFKPN